MRPNRIFLFAVSTLLGVFGLGAILYGLAKVATAEPKQRTDVVVSTQDKSLVAIDPADPALREFGFKACGVGAVCLFVSAAGILFGMRPGSYSPEPPPPAS
jgi:hypothetical protein